MRRKLLLLNLALVALIALAGWRLHQQRIASEARFQGLTGAKVVPVKGPQAAPVPAPQPVEGAAYLDVAQKMLFARDRNSQVIVEPEVVKEKPLPPLPIVHGIMNLGDGPTIIMGEKGSARHRGMRVGEQFGEFKIVSLEKETLVLGWEDRQISKQLNELAPAPDTQAAAVPSGVPDGYTPAPPQKPVPPAPAEPGPEVAGGKACVPGDDSPAGTISQGFKKVIARTPFGSACRWEPVQ